jgi:hypothetical protein
MDLRTILMKQIGVTRRIVMDGHEAIPAWRIRTPRTDWVILSRFDQTDPARQEWVLHNIRRFMAWTFAQSFVVTGVVGSAPTALMRGDQESVLGIACSRSECFVTRQAIRRGFSISFGRSVQIEAGAIDTAYWNLLPAQQETIVGEEAERLNAIFGIDGELSARWL